MTVKMVDQFTQFREIKKKAKKNKPKGPIDLKKGRQQVAEWNKENRKP